MFGIVDTDAEIGGSSDAICKFYGIERPAVHNALEDAILGVKMLEAMLKTMGVLKSGE